MTLYRTDGIAFDPVVLEKLLAMGDYEVILSKYIDVFVVPKDQDRMRQSITLPILMEKVPEGGLYKLGYRRMMDGLISYFEMNLVKTADSSGAVTFILGLRNVDEEARAVGANAFISKPLFRSRLVKTFSTLVDSDDFEDQGTPFVALETMNLQGKRALLVEDNALNAEIAREILEMTGLTVDHAADGVEAVDSMAECEDGYSDHCYDGECF